MSGKGSEEHTIFDEKSKLDMPEAEYAGSQNNLVSSTSLVSVQSFGILLGEFDIKITLPKFKLLLNSKQLMQDLFKILVFILIILE